MKDKLMKELDVGDTVAFPVENKGRFFTKAVVEIGEIIEISPSGRTVIQAYFGNTVRNANDIIRIQK